MSGVVARVPDSALGSWSIEVVLWDRIVRQLRGVGDAMAWRLFGYDRRFIIALSRNEAPGPFVGKVNLAPLGRPRLEQHRRLATAAYDDGILPRNASAGDQT